MFFITNSLILTQLFISSFITRQQIINFQTANSSRIPSDCSSSSREIYGSTSSDGGNSSSSGKGGGMRSPRLQVAKYLVSRSNFLIGKALLGCQVKCDRFLFHDVATLVKPDWGIKFQSNTSKYHCFINLLIHQLEIFVSKPIGSFVVKYVFTCLN